MLWISSRVAGFRSFRRLETCATADLEVCATEGWFFGLPLFKGGCSFLGMTTDWDPDARMRALRLHLASGGTGPQRLRMGLHSRGYLPHLKREGGVYFVTWRLAGSLPQSLVLQLKRARAEALRVGKSSSRDIERTNFRRVEQCLDSGLGACWLRQAKIADLVTDGLRFHDGEWFDLKSWVVMPNHVHAVIQPLGNHLLGGILKSLKQFTARKANAMINRVGQPFWQRESYDHLIRDRDELERIKRYIIRNPVKAGLCQTPEDWPWSSATRK